MANEFLSPYATSKVLSGVLEALPKIRATFLQENLVGAPLVTEKDSVNFDEEFATLNTSAKFVDPKADVTPIQLGDFSTKELYFAYTKEGWGTDDFNTINVRQLGQQFGQVDPLANQAARLIAKAAIAEQRFQNLFEKCFAHLALYGGYRASSDSHRIIQYDFGRNVTSTYAALSATGSLVSSVNLTTTAVTAPWDSGTTILPVLATSGGFTAGDRAWTKALVTAGKSTPVADLVKMYETSARYGAPINSVIMQDDAYAAFVFDVETNYSKDADRSIITMVQNAIDKTPRPQNIDGLTYRRSWMMDNGINVAIYTYNAKLNDRDTSVEEALIGNGWVIGIPAPDYGIKVYGRIKHRKANFQPLPRYINSWTDPKSGDTEYEMHSNFLIGHKRINALTAWKVV